MSRSIFHIRIPGFEVQSERLLDSGLRQRSLAIISSHHQNGTLMAVSPEATEEGLYPGLSVNLARKMSRITRFLPYNKTLYERVNNYVYQQVNHYSPLTEPEHLGQYYLDMSGMERQYRGLRQAAFSVSRTLRDVVSLKGQVGISSSKLVSSISTAVTEEEIHEIPGGSETRFLDPLPSRLLPSLQSPALDKLISFLFLRTIRDIRSLTSDRAAAAVLFGTVAAALLYRESRGDDPRLVTPPRQGEQIVNQLVLNADTNHDDILLAAVRRLAEQTAYELRKRHRLARYYSLEIHYSDGFRKSGKGRLPANSDAEVVKVSADLFTKANERRNRIRSLMVCARDLVSDAEQLGLFSQREDRERRISIMADTLREKYGFESIMTAAGLFGSGAEGLARERRKCLPI